MFFLRNLYAPLSLFVLFAWNPLYFLLSPHVFSAQLSILLSPFRGYHPYKVFLSPLSKLLYVPPLQHHSTSCITFLQHLPNSILNSSYFYICLMLACSSVKSASVIYIFVSPSEPNPGILPNRNEKKKYLLKKYVSFYG